MTIEYLLYVQDNLATQVDDLLSKQDKLKRYGMKYKEKCKEYYNRVKELKVLMKQNKKTNKALELLLAQVTAHGAANGLIFSFSSRISISYLLIGILSSNVEIIDENEPYKFFVTTNFGEMYTIQVSIALHKPAVLNTSSP